MCYVVAKDRYAHGCYAYETRQGQHLVELKRELNEVVGFKGVQVVTISRPEAYMEYAPYDENGHARRIHDHKLEALEDLIEAANGQPVLVAYPFSTEKGLSMRYAVKGREIFFDRKEKSVTRATVMKAFFRARQLQHEKGFVNEPKELGTFGASYLYPVFLRIGVCMKKPEKD